MNISYSRVMLKLSGEMVGGETGEGIRGDALDKIASEVVCLKRAGVDVSVVIGGGNIFRGAQSSGLSIERAPADHMGMLATLINALALQAVLENKYGLSTRVMSAIAMQDIAEPYIRRKAIKHIEKGRVVIFGAGTGSPFFSTDTAAALRAREIGADIILKATKVDGVYDKDPKKYQDAKKYDKLSYLDVISNNLKVMDATAVTMCMEASIPILVFKLDCAGSSLKVLQDSSLGTLVN